MRGTLTLKVKRLEPYAKLPSQAHVGDAGWDIHNLDPLAILPRSTSTVRTGIAVEIPEGWYAQIHDRGSLSARGLVTSGGVMDATYRGEWFVTLHNLGDEVVGIEAGMRIAQFVLHRVPYVWIAEVEELTPTNRGAGGFGSTGA